MYSPHVSQHWVDRFVLTFAVLLVIALAGIVFNVPALLMLPLPLVLGLLTLLSVVGEHGWPDRTATIAIVAFHVISTVFWVVALITLHDDAITIAGMPTSTGLLTLVAWPFYTLFSGALYAFCADRIGLTRIQVTLDPENANE